MSGCVLHFIDASGDVRTERMHLFYCAPVFSFEAIECSQPALHVLEPSRIALKFAKVVADCVSGFVQQNGGLAQRACCLAQRLVDPHQLVHALERLS